MGEEMKIEKLTLSTNCPLWKHSMITFIKGKSLLPILNQTHLRPADEASQQDLEVYDARLMTIICNALNEHYYGSVIHCETASEIWKTIAMRESNISATKFQL